MLALLADLVVAERGARWTHVFARRGMVPHAGDPYYLPRIIPFHRLSELALLSDPVTSEQLGEWGVVNRVVEPGQAMPTAPGLAARLAEGPTRPWALPSACTGAPSTPIWPAPLRRSERHGAHLDDS